MSLFLFWEKSLLKIQAQLKVPFASSQYFQPQKFLLTSIDLLFSRTTTCLTNRIEFSHSWLVKMWQRRTNRHSSQLLVRIKVSSLFISSYKIPILLTTKHLLLVSFLKSLWSPICITTILWYLKIKKFLQTSSILISIRF